MNNVMTTSFPTLDDILDAQGRIRGHAHITPVMTSRALNDITGARLFFKCESFQKVGAFKYRGATNAVYSLTDEQAARGVATHSSGNHAAALALAARTRGIPSYIVMPDNAPRVKKEAVASYGAEITYCEPTLKARETTLERVVARTGAEVIHPYNDWRIIAGQGTAALELFDEIADLDIVMTPVGGGGLLSGTALTASYISPSTRVIAAEPENANDAFQSFYAGCLIPSNNPKTVADGLLTSLGDKTFAVICQHVYAVVTVSEDSIIEAMRMIWERMKIVVEPSSAVPLGSILEGKVDCRKRRVGIILSGGNVDLGNLPWSA